MTVRQGGAVSPRALRLDAAPDPDRYLSSGSPVDRFILWQFTGQFSTQVQLSNCPPTTGP
jgi:hypothetical protein